MIIEKKKIFNLTIMLLYILILFKNRIFQNKENTASVNISVLKMSHNNNEKLRESRAELEPYWKAYYFMK